MIQVIIRCLLIMVNKKIHKNKHSHEMTRFRNRIAVWSPLHEPVRISELSHGLVFESPVYRVHNKHESKSDLDSLLPVLIMEWVRVLQLKHTLTHKYTRTVTCARRYTSIHTYIQIYTYMTHACTPNIHLHSRINTQNTYNFKLTHTKTHMHTH